MTFTKTGLGFYIVLTTDHGQAYGPDWEVGYPDADITDVEPQPWQAGWTGQPITISGSNLGTNSTVSIDPSDITISGLQFASDGSAITGYVTIPSTETEVEANITVTPGYSGCSGNCFFGDPQDSSGQSQSQSVPITTSNSVPDRETTVAIAPGQGTLAYTEYFQQTLSDSALDSFDGRTVTEQTGQTGTDTCYNNDPNNTFIPMTGVTGTSWVVAQQYPGALNGHNQWGGDDVGYGSNAVTFYRGYDSSNGITSCGFTLYQNMSINTQFGLSLHIRPTVDCSPLDDNRQPVLHISLQTAC